MEKKESRIAGCFWKSCIIFLCISFVLGFIGFCFMVYEHFEPPISSSLRKGALEIKPIITERQTGKAVEGGIYLQACAKVPDGLNNKQIKATLLEGLNTLIEDNEECKWIALWLTTGECDRELKDIFVKGEYRDNKINFLNYNTDTGPGTEFEDINLEK